MTGEDVTATLREWCSRLLGTLRARRPDRDLEEERRLHLKPADAHLGGVTVRM